MTLGNYKISWHHLVEQGRTTCTVYKDDKIVNVGVAVLSENDQYDRRIGRKVSLTRALDFEKSKIPKHERKYIWTALRAKGVNIKG